MSTTQHAEEDREEKRTEKKQLDEARKLNTWKVLHKLPSAASDRTVVRNSHYKAAVLAEQNLENRPGIPHKIWRDSEVPDMFKFEETLPWYYYRGV